MWNKSSRNLFVGIYLYIVLGSILAVCNIFIGRIMMIPVIVVWIWAFVDSLRTICRKSYIDRVPPHTFREAMLDFLGLYGEEEA